MPDTEQVGEYTRGKVARYAAAFERDPSSRTQPALRQPQFVARLTRWCVAGPPAAEMGGSTDSPLPPFLGRLRHTGRPGCQEVRGEEARGGPACVVLH